MDTLTRIAYENPELAELDPAARRLALRDLMLEGGASRSDAARVADEIDGWGPLSGLMRDEAVTDILVNSFDDVRVERAGALEPANVRFEDAAHLSRSVQRWVGRAGGRVDASHPIADARLDDGSRLHVVLPPVAPCGPLVSIRRFPRTFTLDALVEGGMLRGEQAGDLRDAVTTRRSIAVAGATGTGKTTLLNALLREIPEGERVVTIEEVPEITAAAGHLVSLVSRSSNSEGVGAVTLGDLVRASLRMRPDRIVVGEVRGAEARDALDAMATGHKGSMITLHASSAGAVPERLLALASHGASDSQIQRLAPRIADALDVIVFLERRAGSRRAAFVGDLRDLRDGQ